MDNLLTKLRELQDKLPVQQRTLCRYIIKNSKKVYLMTVSELVEVSGVGRATVMRFLESIGYHSFTDFKKELSKASYIDFQADRISNPFFWNEEANYTNPEDSVQRCYKESLTLMSQLNASLDRKMFHDIATMLIEAKRVNILGLRSTQGLSEYFRCELSYLLENVRDLSFNEGMVYDSVLTFHEGDVLLAITTCPSSSTTIRVAKLCHQRKIPVIVITDSMDSVLRQYSSLAIVLPRSQSSRLTVLPMILIMEALFNEIGIRTAPVSVNTMNEINEYLMSNKLLID